MCGKGGESCSAIICPHSMSTGLAERAVKWYHLSSFHVDGASWSWQAGERHIVLDKRMERIKGVEKVHRKFGDRNVRSLIPSDSPVSTRQLLFPLRWSFIMSPLNRAASKTREVIIYRAPWSLHQTSPALRTKTRCDLNDSDVLNHTHWPGPLSRLGDRSKE